MAKRYIDADVLIEKAKKEASGLDVNDFDVLVEWLVDKIPSADVVEVVRCKDCKYRPKSIDGATQGFDVWFAYDSKCPCECDDGWYNWYPKDDWFCANGERRTDGEIH